ncbi:replication initiator [Actinomadura rupiterrae]|uniref:replication initiator n=1 Tax=Actinomadura rupiterrae TaxID=559627 RepID=UPI0020A435C9|nr:replication initiator [Actinomadura rupiterrae]MCP2343693.1 hypothetical protein [Actinomadura rupiterrae]
MAGLGTAGAISQRVAVGDWWSWSAQVERAGFCWRPVRLRGRAAAVDVATGEAVAEYSTEGGPDGSVLVACKDRRASVCGPCAEVYRRDVWHLVASGLHGRDATDGAGGEVPGSVAGHPVVFATLTAPSFGALHTARDGGVCRERPGRCRHGLPLGCARRHTDGDAWAGLALCWDCYDYDGHVLWHAAAPALWARTTVYLYRALARLAGARLGRPVSVRAVRGLLRVSYVKVAEWQRRAAVHFHAVLRLDGVDAGDPGRLVAPPAWADAGLLGAALREAAGRVAVPLPSVGGGVRVARWGSQVDVSPVVDVARTAAYVAKYATKTAGDTVAGLPVRAFGTADLAHVRGKVGSTHVMLLVLACLRLAKRGDCARWRLGEHVHTLGFSGHFCSKSRHYSVTLSSLRQARRDWQADQAARAEAGRADPWAVAHRRASGARVEIAGDWRFVGMGYARLHDADIAASLAQDHAMWRELRRERDAEEWEFRRLIAEHDAVRVGQGP